MHFHDRDYFEFAKACVLPSWAHEYSSQLPLQPGVALTLDVSRNCVSLLSWSGWEVGAFSPWPFSPSVGWEKAPRTQRRVEPHEGRGLDTYPSQNAFIGMWYAQGTSFCCVKPLRIWDLSDRVASIILTNTIPPWEILSKHNSSQPRGIETFEWHQVQGYVPWLLPGVQISSVAGKWVGVTVTQGGRKINTLLSKLCHLTRTPAWKESSCISFWR